MGWARQDQTRIPVAFGSCPQRFPHSFHSLFKIFEAEIL
jgi:hypothetical protein